MDLKTIRDATRALLLATATAYAIITPPVTAGACAGCKPDPLGSTYCNWDGNGTGSWCGWRPYGCGPDGTDTCYFCEERGACIT
jgi:hypothetical protein